MGETDGLADGEAVGPFDGFDVTGAFVGLEEVGLEVVGLEVVGLEVVGGGVGARTGAFVGLGVTGGGGGVPHVPNVVLTELPKSPPDATSSDP